LRARGAKLRRCLSTVTERQRTTAEWLEKVEVFWCKVEKFSPKVEVFFRKGGRVQMKAPKFLWKRDFGALIFPGGKT